MVEMVGKIYIVGVRHLQGTYLNIDDLNRYRYLRSKYDNVDLDWKVLYEQVIVLFRRKKSNKWEFFYKYERCLCVCISVCVPLFCKSILT